VNEPALPASVLATFPDFTSRVGIIFGALREIIGRRFLHDPRFFAIVIPLCRRLTQVRLRIERMLARLAAGKPAQRRSPTPSPPPPVDTTPADTTPADAMPAEAPPTEATPDVARPRIPTGPAWLLNAIGHEVAGQGSQLEALLAEPAVAELLARTPALAQLLHPVRRMLGIARLPSERRRPRQPRLRRARPKLASPRRESLPAWLQGRPACASLQPLPWMVEKKRRS